MHKGIIWICGLKRNRWIYEKQLHLILSLRFFIKRNIIYYKRRKSKESFKWWSCSHTAALFYYVVVNGVVVYILRIHRIIEASSYNFKRDIFCSIQGETQRGGRKDNGNKTICSLDEMGFKAEMISQYGRSIRCANAESVILYVYVTAVLLHYIYWTQLRTTFCSILCIIKFGRILYLLHYTIIMLFLSSY